LSGVHERCFFRAGYWPYLLTLDYAGKDCQVQTLLPVKNVRKLQPGARVIKLFVRNLRMFIID
jgi:hypothetical protein